MNRMETMSGAALDAMIHVLDLVPQDRVLVVTDRATSTCGQAFSEGAKSYGCPVNIYNLPEHNRPLQAMPDEMPALLDDATVVINAIVGDCFEIPFRLQWINVIELCGHVRMGHSPGIDEDMMVSGPMNVDYGRMLAMAKDLMDDFAGAEAVHITTTAGTDMRLDLTNRVFTHDLKSTLEVGANLPCGEIYCAPVETGAEGILVIDGSFGCHRPVSPPVTITINSGQAVDVTGGDDEVVGIINELMDTDSGSRTIAELGIGLNPGARMTERMLEAEKASRTAHIAFGSNEGFPGGLNHSITHLDYLFTRPTMEVFYPDGAVRLVMENGEPV
ncbi:MAG: aminopeptidase [Candidatus Krumholzibacteria bacterium]|nr:aminopeptidase [Candidatus Krumholzibacteria bacterium]